jgi:probable rRNA maturation factor
MSGVEVLVQDRSGAPIDLQQQKRLAEALLARLGFASGELGVTYVGPAEMEELNRGHMGHSGPTDVLTFPLDAGKGGNAAPAAAADVPLLLGDIIICPQVAERQAGAAGHGLDDELCLLLVHGMLHLAGLDHEADQGEMEARQAELVRDLCLRRKPSDV